MLITTIIDMVLGISLAFAAIYFWNKNKGNNTLFLIVLAALFNYLYSFFRVLENAHIISDNWTFVIGDFPVIKFLIISLSMLFLLLGIIKMAGSENNDKY